MATTTATDVAEHDQMKQKTTNNSLKILFQIQLDSFTTTYFTDWNVAFRYEWNMGDAEWTTAPGTNPPNDLSARDTKKMIEAVQSSIRRGMPDDVRERLPTGFLTQYPSAILADVRKVMVD